MMRVIEWTAIVLFGIFGFSSMAYAVYLYFTLLRKKK